MPLDEYVHEYKDLFAQYNLKNTFLISPTTSDARITRIDAETDGFIYAVSASSTTGAKSSFTTEQENYFRKLKDRKLSNPFLIGFGISSRASFARANEYASGAIVGSAFITLLKTSTDFKKDIDAFVKDLKA
jgi:tryptophan synthase alpha chain